MPLAFQLTVDVARLAGLASKFVASKSQIGLRISASAPFSLPGDVGRGRSESVTSPVSWKGAGVALKVSAMAGGSRREGGGEFVDLLRRAAEPTIYPGEHGLLVDASQHQSTLS